MTNDNFVCAVERNHKRLFIIALSYTKNHQDAEDILQNVFLKLWKHNREFTEENHMDKWLTRVCINECKNYIKLPFKKNTSLDEAAQLYTFDKPRDFDVFNALMSLSRKEHTAIVLFYYEDMSTKEIAKLLNIKEPTIKTRLRRGRMKLKEILGEDWIYE